MRLFDAYITVDWSAASVPRRGKDSIWMRYEAAGRSRLLNPSTRRQAMAVLESWLAGSIREGRRTLVGVDFNLGYPAGFAERIGCKRWRDVWAEISRSSTDGPRNTNNRFQTAARLNRRITGQRGPFWGCPPSQEGETLGRKKSDAARDGLAELRMTEARIRGPKSAFQLSGVGAVGSQTLTGIAALERLRFRSRLAGDCRIWPFETGLRAPLDSPVVFAEVYPSQTPLPNESGEVKDAAQVRAVTRRLRRQDGQGKLRRLFEGPRGAGIADRRKIVQEEGWILGVV